MAIERISQTQIDSLGKGGCYLKWNDGGEFKVVHLNWVERFFRWLGCCYANTTLKAVSKRLCSESKLPEALRLKMSSIFERSYPGLENPYTEKKSSPEEVISEPETTPKLEEKLSEKIAEGEISVMKEKQPEPEVEEKIVEPEVEETIVEPEVNEKVVEPEIESIAPSGEQAEKQQQDCSEAIIQKKKIVDEKVPSRPEVYSCWEPELEGVSDLFNTTEVTAKDHLPNLIREAAQIGPDSHTLVVGTTAIILERRDILKVKVDAMIHPIVDSRLEDTEDTEESSFTKDLWKAVGMNTLYEKIKAKEAKIRTNEPIMSKSGNLSNVIRYIIHFARASTGVRVGALLDCCFKRLATWNKEKKEGEKIKSVSIPVMELAKLDGKKIVDPMDVFLIKDFVEEVIDFANRNPGELDQIRLVFSDQDKDLTKHFFDLTLEQSVLALRKTDLVKSPKISSKKLPAGSLGVSKTPKLPPVNPESAKNKETVNQYLEFVERMNREKAGKK